jgi:hypothetical protein
VSETRHTSVLFVTSVVSGPLSSSGEGFGTLQNDLPGAKRAPFTAIVPVTNASLPLRKFWSRIASDSATVSAIAGNPNEYGTLNNLHAKGLRPAWRTNRSQFSEAPAS